MGRQYITICREHHLYRLYMRDVRSVFKQRRKITPKIPDFESKEHSPEPATETEFELEFEPLRL
jgi:hypothetical protein